MAGSHSTTELNRRNFRFHWERPQRLKAARASAAVGIAEQAAEKVVGATSGAKAYSEKQRFIAALKALRHPRPVFFRSL